MVDATPPRRRVNWSVWLSRPRCKRALSPFVFWNPKIPIVMWQPPCQPSAIHETEGAQYQSKGAQEIHLELLLWLYQGQGEGEEIVG